MTERRHVVVFTADAGGGHRATADALRTILEETGRYRVTLLNPYRDLIPHYDLTRRVTGRSGESFYNDVILRGGRTGLTCWLFYAGLKLNYLLYGRATAKLLAQRFADLAPDLVVSVIPLANGVISDALDRYRLAHRQGAGDVPLAILITDWREIAANVWFPRRNGYHAICGTRDSTQQALRMPQGRNVQVHETDGLLIRPAFAAATARPSDDLGLDRDRPVVTVLYGAQGSDRMLMVARVLAELPQSARRSAQIVFLCGRNAEVAAALRAQTLPYDARILEFTDEVPAYLAASSLFIGKPGPGSVSEAMAANLHLLLDRKLVLPQETPVIDHVLRTGHGACFATGSDLAAAFTRMLSQPARAAPVNRSATQVLDIIDDLLAPGPEGAGAAKVRALECPH